MQRLPLQHPAQFLESHEDVVGPLQPIAATQSATIAKRNEVLRTSHSLPSAHPVALRFK
jgi:hypothetical protein